MNNQLLYGCLKFTLETNCTNQSRLPVLDGKNHTTITKLVSKLDRFKILIYYERTSNT